MLLPHTLLAALLLSPVFASPLPFADLGAREETQRRAWDLDARDLAPVSFLDYSVPLTFPTAGIVWQAGGQGYITWNASLPAGITNGEVLQTATRLVLGYTAAGVVGLNLDIANPLGVNIPLYTAPYSYSFTLPADLPTRTTYILSFQGSSGNISPEFTIIGTTAASSTPASSATSASIDFVSVNPTTSAIPTLTSTTAESTLSIFSSSLVALVPTDPTTTSDAGASSTTQTLDATSSSSSTPSSSAPSSSQTSSATSSSSSSASSSSASGTVSAASPVVNKSAAPGSFIASSALLGLVGLVAVLVL